MVQSTCITVPYRTAQSGIILSTYFVIGTFLHVIKNCNIIYENKSKI